MSGHKDGEKMEDHEQTHGDFVVSKDHARAVRAEDLDRARDQLAARRRQFSDEVSLETLRLVVG